MIGLLHRLVFMIKTKVFFINIHVRISTCTNLGTNLKRILNTTITICFIHKSFNFRIYHVSSLWKYIQFFFYIQTKESSVRYMLTLIAVCTPYLLIFIVSVWRSLFGNIPFPSIFSILTVCGKIKDKHLGFSIVTLTLT